MGKTLSCLFIDYFDERIGILINNVDSLSDDGFVETENKLVPD